MDFTNLYEQPCVLAKQIEFRWFHSKLMGEGVVANDYGQRRRLCHNMPFLRRTLAYTRPQASQKRSRGRIPAANAHRRKHRKFDLLLGLFHHQCPSAKRHVSPMHHNDASSEVDCGVREKVSSGRGKIHGIAFPSSVRMKQRKQKEATVSLLVLGKTARASTGGSKKLSALHQPRKVFFHYFHVRTDNVPAVNIEMREDARCPFCFFDPVSDLKSSSASFVVSQSSTSVLFSFRFASVHISWTHDPLLDSAQRTTIFQANERR
mmetsp:Transcript_62832/g.185558  ORF Transcript_62832/g.185558 Transcript_62832/m.185558 type:complete len:263 (+) Transcript_62832:292-1080(+)